ncbi:MAG: YraN family protein [Rhodobacteraceae bacterium]|uniref:YraN family protein n=1 Tax=Albidovulum sp. TaxID=1872424 RepID=UPI001DAABF3A|nr:YraN family protein [uncultured Defluviimonas sp.]MCB2127451.1 YraN family protein [Paracoccaceae bacterium]MCC0069675.1 YraN family protein [Paracoccaceae bacterium]
MRGQVSHHAGRVAETQVEAHYRGRGYQVAARRWRGPGGEIDLVLRAGDRLVFVEVKAARTHAIAAERLSFRQMSRIAASASAFLAGEPRGQDSEMSFEVALVDGAGRIGIVENAFGV